MGVAAMIVMSASASPLGRMAFTCAAARSGRGETSWGALHCDALPGPPRQRGASAAGLVSYFEL